MVETRKKFFLRSVIVLFACLVFITNEEGIRQVQVHENFVVDTPQLATAVFEQEFVEEEANPLLIGKTFIGFKEALGYRESRGNYFVVNPFGYMGKYQFGKSALSFYGVPDADAFLKSPEQQERLFTLSIKRNKWLLQKEISRFSGKKIGGIHITESGILAAAHLAGAQNVKNYFKNRGAYAFADANGTTLQNYLKNFAGYDVTHITPEEMPRF